MISFILNFPYTIAGLILGLVSKPIEIKFSKKPYVFIVNVENFWWTAAYLKGARAMTIGNVVLLGPNLEKNDLEHELIHIEQYQRMPLIHPFLYYLEFKRRGYKNNKYEEEAYRRAGNIYKID